MALSSCDRQLGVLVEFKQGSQALSHFEVWHSGFLSRCKRAVMPPVVFRQGPRLFLGMQQGSQKSHHVVKGSL